MRSAGVVSDPSPQAAQAAVQGTLFVVGTSTKSLTTVSELVVQLPKTGCTDKIPRETVSYAHDSRDIVLPSHEDHACTIAPMFVAHTSLADLLTTPSATSMPLAFVPSHRHYTLTHAQQRRAAAAPAPPSCHPSPTPVAANAAAPSAPAAPASPTSHPVPQSPQPHTSDSPLSNDIVPFLHPAAHDNPPTSHPTAAAHSSAPAPITPLHPVHAPRISASNTTIDSQLALTSGQTPLTDTTMAEGATGESARHQQMVQEVLAVIARASLAPVSGQSGQSGQSPSSHGGRLLAVLARHKTADLALLLHRLRQFSDSMAPEHACC